MLRIRIDLLPAMGGKATRIDELLIVNDGSGTKERGNYRVWRQQFKTDVRSSKAYSSPVSGEVRGFPRLELGPWDLLYLALKDLVGKRNE